MNRQELTEALAEFPAPLPHALAQAGAEKGG
jgi:hypothetical protein